jgi:quercetin dioxygenase-like cupin family protein
MIMKIGHTDQLDSKHITHPDASNAAMKVLVSPTEGWEGYVMRVLEVEENGHTPKHSHPWPHINYMIEGEGELMMNGEVYPVKAGSYAYVPSDTLHQFKNVGKDLFKFICIVPEEGHK